MGNTPYHFGQTAEALVAVRLVRQGASILARRWRCRAGEIDLVAQCGAQLLFVEVKARGPGNWDSDGLEAIDRSKRRRLSRAATLFLAGHPELAALECRFDVALVGRDSNGSAWLRSYLPNAFGFEA